MLTREQPVTRVIVATPRFGGADGVSAVARQYVDVVKAAAPAAAIEVWSLAGESRPESLAPDVEFVSANDSRITFTTMPLAATGSHDGTLVIVMHVHLLPPMLPLERRGARLACVLHGVEAWKPLRLFERMALRRCWRVAAVSAFTRDRFRAENPDLAELPVVVCHSGVPAAGTSGGTEPALPPQPFALIVARMSQEDRYKGHDQLLAIWPLVRSAAPSARLVIVGDGDDRDRLEQLAGQLGVAAAVAFTGRVSDAHLSALYRAATLFVMPSRDEGLGLVFLESMQAGTPCVAAHGAADEIITDGVDGLLVPAGDDSALCEAVVALLTDHGLRDRLGAAARQRIEDAFTRSRFARRAADWLELTPVTQPC